MATHKIDIAKAKKARKPDLGKNMNVSELKAAVKWLMEYIGLK